MPEICFCGSKVYLQETMETVGEIMRETNVRSPAMLQIY